MVSYLKSEKAMRERLASCWLRTRLFLPGAAILLCVQTGCSASLPLEQKCPAPPPVPAALASSDMPDARSYSQKASNWLKKVELWLSELQSEKTP